MNAALPRRAAGACPFPETALSYAQALAAPAAHSHRGNTAAARRIAQSTESANRRKSLNIQRHIQRRAAAQSQSKAKAS